MPLARQAFSVTALFLALSASFVSCQDNNVSPAEQQKTIDKGEVTQLDASPIVSMDQNEQVQYAHQNLYTIGRAAMTLARKNTDFRKTVYSEIEKQFDGESNVLIKDLIGKISTDGIDNKLYNAIVHVTGSEDKAAKTLTAFNNIEERNYYPQIYIPFYKELKSEGKIGVSDPMVIIYTEDKATHPGYHLNGNNELVESGKVLDDTYVRENEVWVFSINERVDSEGNVRKDNAIARVQGASYPHAKFEYFRVGLHKESVAGGASEVHIKRYLSFYTWDQYSPGNPHMLQYTSEDHPGDGDGWRIAQISRGDVAANQSLYVDWIACSNWPDREGNINGAFYHTDYLYYMIFEYDAWPTGKKSHTLIDAAGYPGVKIYFRSAHVPYTKNHIPEYAAEGWVVDKDYVGFNVTY